VKRELYWVPGIKKDFWYLRVFVPNDDLNMDRTIGYVERLPLYASRQYRGALYKSHLPPPETCIWEMFETPAQAQAWVYSLAVLEG
jgi:hypothetical protein